MTTTTEQEFIDSIDGNLTSEQVAQLLQLHDEGDTGAQPEKEGEPDASTDADDGSSKVDGKADDEQRNDGDGSDKADAKADDGPSDEPDPENTVILAKDGKHTISYDKLVEAREAEKRWKAEAAAAQEELAALRAQAQARADAGQAPTETDKQVATAEAAIAEGVDPELFGDFSEEALARGIQTLIEQKVAAAMAPVTAQLEPIQQAQRTSAAEGHYRAIYEAHPDADSIAESKELAEWIAAQPSFVRNGYESVLSAGTTAEVIELFDAFKHATNVPGAKPTPSQGDLKAQADAVIARTPAPVPTSLSDFPGGHAGAASKYEAMAAMTNGPELLAAMHDMTGEQIERFMNNSL